MTLVQDCCGQSVSVIRDTDTGQKLNIMCANTVSNFLIPMDDTSTTTYSDNDDDKTLILSGPERMRYFGGDLSLLATARPRKKSWFQQLKELFN